MNGLPTADEPSVFFLFYDGSLACGPVGMVVGKVKTENNGPWCFCLKGRRLCDMIGQVQFCHHDMLLGSTWYQYLIEWASAVRTVCIFLRCQLWIIREFSVS